MLEEYKKAIEAESDTFLKLFQEFGPDGEIVMLPGILSMSGWKLLNRLIVTYRLDCNKIIFELSAYIEPITEDGRTSYPPPITLIQGDKSNIESFIEKALNIFNAMK